MYHLKPYIVLDERDEIMEKYVTILDENYLMMNLWQFHVVFFIVSSHMNLALGSLIGIYLEFQIE